MAITFDQAIELLEITDISKISIENIPQIVKKAKKRWHPDNVTHLNDPVLIQEYNTKFQEIDEASQMVSSFLEGTYQSGQAFTNTDNKVNRQPEDIIRENANEMQETLRGLWSLIKEKRYKWTLKEVILSDGYKLTNILNEDFKEDIAKLSVISFFYGCLLFGLLVIITGLFSPVLRTITGIIWFLQALACIIGFLPLSRFWLPTIVQEIMFKFINFGLAIYNWASDSASHWLVEILVQVPVLFAYLIKYVILFPLYELAKAIVGEKIVGVVKQNVNYYAEAAEWYIDELITKDPLTMSSDELFHLSYVNSELSDVQSKI
jgi:hypothetical protein